MNRLIAFNKPFAVLSQFTDHQGRPTLADYINDDGVYCAGRLDFDSEGLLLLTDDGKLQQRISAPRFKLPKTYLVQVEGIADETALEKLHHGITLNDGPTRPAKASIIADPGLWPRTPPIRHRASIATSWLRIEIREGRNRQIRRMTAAIGHPTLRLVRWSIGDWNIEGLASGQWRLESVAIMPPLFRGQSCER